MKEELSSSGGLLQARANGGAVRSIGEPGGLAAAAVVAISTLAMLVLGLRLSLLVFPSLISLSLSLWLGHKTARTFDLGHLTISGFWQICFLATIYIPSFVAYSEGQDPYRGRFLLAVQGTCVMVPVGFLLTNLVSGFQAREVREYYDKPISQTQCESGIRATNVFLLVLALGLTMLYLRQVSEIALFEIFRNPVDWATYEALRLTTFAALESRLDYAYALLRGVFYPLLILVGLGYYLRSRRRFWLIIFLVSAISGIVFAALDAAKGPVSVILMSVGFFIFLYKGGRIRKRAIALWGGLLLAFPLLVLITVLGGTSDGVFQQAVGSLAHRVFVTNDTVAYDYFEIFPSQVEFLHGRSIEKVAWLTGAPFFDAGQYVFLDMSDTLGKYSEGDSAGGSFFAKFYADFGMPGVLVGGLLTGVILQSIQVFLVRRRKTIPYLATYAFLFYVVFQINGEALPSVLLSRGAIIALTFPWMVEKLSRLFSSFALVPQETAQQGH